MKRTHLLFNIITISMLMLACNKQGGLVIAGFWDGLWHGLTLAIRLFFLLFDQGITILAQQRTTLYGLGYIFGLVIHAAMLILFFARYGIETKPRKHSPLQ